MKVIIRYGIFGCGEFCWRLQILIRKKNLGAAGLFKKWNNNFKKCFLIFFFFFANLPTSFLLGVLIDWLPSWSLGALYRFRIHVSVSICIPSQQRTTIVDFEKEKRENVFSPSSYFILFRVCVVVVELDFLFQGASERATVVRHLWQVRAYDETPCVELLDAGENQMKDPHQPGRGDEGSPSESLCSTISPELLLAAAVGCLSNSGCWLFYFFPPSSPSRKLPWQRGHTYRVCDMNPVPKNNNTAPSRGLCCLLAAPSSSSVSYSDCHLLDSKERRAPTSQQPSCYYIM